MRTVNNKLVCTLNASSSNELYSLKFFIEFTHSCLYQIASTLLVLFLHVFINLLAHLSVIHLFIYLFFFIHSFIYLCNALGKQVQEKSIRKKFRSKCRSHKGNRSGTNTHYKKQQVRQGNYNSITTLSKGN